jgi:DHA2 family multidrug resistance protein
VSDGSSFVASQLLRGVGTIFAMLFLNQAAIQSVSRENASDASGLFNAARNMGGSLALAGVSVLQEQRLWLHSRRLEDTLRANSEQVQSYVAAHGGVAPAARSLAGIVQLQALTMTYVDLFWILAVGIACVLPLVLFLRPLQKNAPLAAH